MARIPKISSCSGSRAPSRFPRPPDCWPRAVIRGGTPHFDYVCRGVTDGVREVMRTSRVPVGFGVLTTDDIDQALARAGGSDGNKGGEVALAAVEMARLLGGLEETGAGRSGLTRT